MITKELFIKAINTIQKLENDNKKLSNILIGDSSCGFCDFGGELIQSFLDVLHADFEMFDEDPILEWWLYEVDDGDKHIWEYTDDGAIVYDLNDIEDLYYYMRKDFSKVKQNHLKGVTEEKVHEYHDMSLRELLKLFGVFDE